ncbi:hypothetical protein [Spiroplasma alleghenense]|uniref:Transmembrane protein n=1 Tax=Spiroplasma alleghenense TaxID=216931 RepID=A0A345Z2L6_9MOLU|nr:hypothetical protein [Spiroplasma alleghenense]AXK50845.1 hypothetical protein SALLE_v1c01690 [Spiroplasma alleghenense]
MSKKEVIKVQTESKLKAPAVLFSYITRFFALFLFVSYIITILILLIGDNLTRNFIGYIFFAIVTASNKFVDSKNMFEAYEIFAISIKVVVPLFLTLILSLLYVLPILISKSRGYRIFTAVMVLIGSIVTIVGAVLLVELKKLFPHSESGGQTVDIFYNAFYDYLVYKSFLIIFLFTSSALFFVSAILLLIEASFVKNGWTDLKGLTFNHDKSKPLIIKFIDGETTFKNKDNKNKKEKVIAVEIKGEQNNESN